MGKYACLILNTYNREMQKWIPVTERLPEEDMYCWVTVEYPENVRCVHNGYYQLGTGFKLIASGWSNVVAWAHEDIFKPYLN
uniref:DUF551 domain-containing protein n=1 Tax=Clostridium sp. NkU-1 TaxID=1095009 RepID=UPI0006D10BFF